jgi:hypothetical protein
MQRAHLIPMRGNTTEHIGHERGALMFRDIRRLGARSRDPTPHGGTGEDPLRGGQQCGGKQRPPTACVAQTALCPWRPIVPGAAAGPPDHGRRCALDVPRSNLLQRCGSLAPCSPSFRRGLNPRQRVCPARQRSHTPPTHLTNPDTATAVSTSRQRAEPEAWQRQRWPSSGRSCPLWEAHPWKSAPPSSPRRAL